jgi:GntR family transcriptional repressor for pyruvate dehydrogenase complex
MPGNVAASSRPARKGVAEALFETLRDKILSGEYPPGTRLPAERELVTLHAVNRGAVREAINRLAQARLVTTVHGGGTRVENFLSTAGLDLLVTLVISGPGAYRAGAARSLIEMRTALAVDAARLAAIRCTDAQYAAIRARVQTLHAISDDQQLLEHLLAIWGVIVDASGNVAYRLAYNTLRDGYRLFGKMLHRVTRESFHAPDYRVLIEAIGAADAARAERGARRIVEKDAAAFIERFSL